jgi:SAM-dependent methyltransferase
MFAQVVKKELRAGRVRTVVDLGCGDFKVGRLIADLGVEYVGVDIVPDLIQANKDRYGRIGVKFEHADLLTRPLPPGDLALLRQVLQHLSNDEIRAVLRNCHSYDALLITEHIPADDAWVPNLDKPHGPDIRLFKRSGVALDAPPFSVPCRVVDVTPHGGKLGGMLRTVRVSGADLGASDTPSTY